MAVKFAHTLGAHVVVFTTSPKKKEDALRLGADEVVISRNADEMKKHADSFYSLFILDAVSAEHDINAYIQLLRRMEEIKAQYETNLFGVIRVTQAVLPIMRKQKSGMIVNISSGAGRFGLPGSSTYVSTKFAIEGMSESMAYEAGAIWNKSGPGRTWSY